MRRGAAVLTALLEGLTEIACQGKPGLPLASGGLHPGPAGLHLRASMLWINDLLQATD